MVGAGVTSASGMKWVLRSEMGSTNPISSRSVTILLGLEARESEEDTEGEVWAVEGVATSRQCNGTGSVDFAWWGTITARVFSSSGARRRLLAIA